MSALHFLVRGLGACISVLEQHVFMSGGLLNILGSSALPQCEHGRKSSMKMRKKSRSRSRRRKKRKQQTMMKQRSRKKRQMKTKMKKQMIQSLTAHPVLKARA